MSLVCSYCRSPWEGSECQTCGSIQSEESVSSAYCASCGSTLNAGKCANCSRIANEAARVANATRGAIIVPQNRKGPKRFLIASTVMVLLIAILGISSWSRHANQKTRNHVAAGHHATTSVYSTVTTTSEPAHFATTLPNNAHKHLTTTTVHKRSRRPVRTTTTIAHSSTTVRNVVPTTVPVTTTSVPRTTTTIKIVTRAQLVATWKSAVIPLVDTLKSYYDQGAIYSNIQSAEDAVYKYFNDTLYGVGGLPQSFSLHPVYIMLVNTIYRCYSPGNSGACTGVEERFTYLYQAISEYH